jgi:hypothetical protein
MPDGTVTALELLLLLNLSAWEVKGCRGSAEVELEKVGFCVVAPPEGLPSAVGGLGLGGGVTLPTEPRLRPGRNELPAEKLLSDDDETLSRLLCFVTTSLAVDDDDGAVVGVALDLASTPPLPPLFSLSLLPGFIDEGTSSAAAMEELLLSERPSLLLMLLDLDDSFKAVTAGLLGGRIGFFLEDSFDERKQMLSCSS